MASLVYSASVLPTTWELKVSCIEHSSSRSHIHGVRRAVQITMLHGTFAIQGSGPALDLAEVLGFLSRLILGTPNNPFKAMSTFGKQVLSGALFAEILKSPS